MPDSIREQPLCAFFLLQKLLKNEKLHDPEEKSGSWSFSFETSGLVDRFLAVLFPRYLNIANGNQCVAVKPENNGFQLRYLQA